MNAFEHLKVALAENGWSIQERSAHLSPVMAWSAWRVVLDTHFHNAVPTLLVEPSQNERVTVAIVGNIDGNMFSLEAIGLHPDDVMPKMQGIVKKLTAAWNAANEVQEAS